MYLLTEDILFHLEKFIDAGLLFLNKKMYLCILLYVRNTYEYHSDNITRDIDILGELYPKIIRNFTSLKIDILKIVKFYKLEICLNFFGKRCVGFKKYKYKK